MTKVLALVLALTTSILITGCGPAKQTGINFSAGNHPELVLNQLGSTWRLFSDGKDVTEVVGLKVDGNIQLGVSTLLDVKLSPQVDVPLPPSFRLQWTPGSPAYCDTCSAQLKQWAHSEKY